MGELTGAGNYSYTSVRINKLTVETWKPATLNIFTTLTLKLDKRSFESPNLKYDSLIV